MTLLSRRDLLAILQTGFGKSLFVQLLARVKEILSSKPSCLIVVCGCYCFIQEHCFGMALDTSRQFSHARFFTSVLVCSSFQILTITFSEGFTYTAFT